MLNAFLFDLDGTLLSIPVDWEGVRRELGIILKSDKPISPIFKTLQGALTERADLREAIFSVLDRYELAAVSNSVLYDGSMGILDFLTGRFSLGLVTLQGRRACDALLKSHGLDLYFGKTVVREDSLSRPQQLLIALKGVNSLPEDSVFVGDRLNDLNSAKEVGTMMILVGKRPELQGAQPDFRFDDINSMKAALENGTLRPLLG